MARYHYLEVETVSFQWERAAGYYWCEDASVITHYIPREPRPPYLVPAEGRMITASVLKENPRLFMEFAGLEPSREAVLGFAERYGMLTEGEVLLEVEGRGPVNAESFGFWSDEIAEMARAFRVWEAVQDRDTSFLRKAIRPHKTGYGYMLPWGDEPSLTAFFISRDGDPAAFRQAKEGDAVMRGRLLLRYLINQKLDVYDIDSPAYMSAVPQVFLDDMGRAGSYLKPATLVAAMWVQLLRAFTGEARYERCQSCGLWEDASDLQKNWRYHPACAAREKQRRYRERLKERGQDGHDS